MLLLDAKGLDVSAVNKNDSTRFVLFVSESGTTSIVVKGTEDNIFKNCASR
ncbi:hypothetical protein J2Y73_000551 [Peribacillus frigoritolerans]|nr:hypothetical protein [Bacillus sp. ISL-53]MCP1490520.1 hypothetical protein [Peribacillus frigoritolerans]